MIDINTTCQCQTKQEAGPQQHVQQAGNKNRNRANSNPEGVLTGWAREGYKGSVSYP